MRGRAEVLAQVSPLHDVFFAFFFLLYPTDSEDSVGSAELFDTS